MDSTSVPARLVDDTDWQRVEGTDAASVELKVLVAPGSHWAGALADDVLRVTSRRLYLLDTARARLAGSGLVLRLRRRRRAGDLVVRLRGRDAGSAARPGSRIELDVLPGNLLRSEQVRRPLDVATVEDVRSGRLAVGTLLTGEQRELLHRAEVELSERVPVEGALRVHGPLVVERMRLKGGWSGSRAFLESCTYPDGTRLVELSVRCVPAGARRAAVAVSRLLEERGLRLADRHRSKTEAWVESITGGPTGS